MKPPRSKTPLVIQQLQWIFQPTAYLQNYSREFGPIFSAMSDRMEVVFVSEPGALKQIFTNEKKSFGASGEANRVLLPLIGPNSLLMLSGEQHRSARQLLMPAFHQESMSSYLDIISRVATEKFAALPNASNSPVAMRTVMQALSLQVIQEVVFGLDSQTDQLRTAIANLADMVSSPLVGLSLFLPWLQQDLLGISPYGKLQRQIAATDDLLLDAIETRRQQNDESRRDILALLLAARDQEGQGLNNSELRDELTTMLLAGHETTATAMSWAVYHICRHEEVKAKLLAELDSLSADAYAMQIFKLPYLTAVCNETLRLTPVVINTSPRVTQEQVELCGYSLDAGTYVVGCIYLLHQREDLYPQPHVFRPERFLDNSFSPFEFMPFGGGARRCLGEMLANFEMRLVLANLFKNFDVRLVSNREEVPRRRVVTLAPEHGVSVIVNWRE